MEIPTHRIYPADDAVPTKISTLGGNLDLLRATLTRLHHLGDDTA